MSERATMSDFTIGAAANPAASPSARSAAREIRAGAVNAAAVLALSFALWFVFLHPNGVLKLYTPMYGFSLVAALVAAIVAVAFLGEGWPLHESSLPRPLRGLLLSAAAVALACLLVYGLFWGFVGRYGVTYFSPRAIVAAGGVGAEFFNARENASTAILYFSTAFIWFAVTVPAALGRWPWEHDTSGVRAFSRVLLVTVNATLAYAVLFHPHVTQLFYPAQTFAGVPPWWSGFARTSSAYFNLGWVMMAIAFLACTDVLWEGWPWRALRPGIARAVVVLAGSVATGIVLFLLVTRAMSSFWGEPFQGGQYTDAPYFRHLHAAEMAGFFLASAFAVDTFLGRAETAARRALWTALALAGAAALHVFYYSPLATRVLGKVPGFAQPEDTSLAWTLLVLALVLLQREFFERWPLRRQPERA